MTHHSRLTQPPCNGEWEGLARTTNASAHKSMIGKSGSKVTRFQVLKITHLCLSVAFFPAYKLIFHKLNYEWCCQDHEHVLRLLSSSWRVTFCHVSLSFMQNWSVVVSNFPIESLPFNPMHRAKFLNSFDWKGIGMQIPVQQEERRRREGMGETVLHLLLLFSSIFVLSFSARSPVRSEQSRGERENRALLLLLCFILHWRSWIRLEGEKVNSILNWLRDVIENTGGRDLATKLLIMQYDYHTSRRQMRSLSIIFSRQQQWLNPTLVSVWSRKWILSDSRFQSVHSVRRSAGSREADVITNQKDSQTAHTNAG